MNAKDQEENKPNCIYHMTKVFGYATEDYKGNCDLSAYCQKITIHFSRQEKENPQIFISREFDLFGLEAIAFQKLAPLVKK